MKTIIFIIAILCSHMAYALDFEIGAGITHMKKPPNSQYWQEPFDNKWDRNSASYYLGVAETSSHSPKWFNAWSNGLTLRGGFTRLGTMTGKALAVTDETYNGVNGCVPSGCSPFSLFITESSTQGLVFTAAPEWATSFGKFFIEAGPFIHRPKMTIAATRVNNWTTDNYYEYKRTTNIGYMAGVGIARGNFSILLSFWRVDAKNKGDPVADNLPPNHDSKFGGIINLTGRLSF